MKILNILGLLVDQSDPPIRLVVFYRIGYNIQTGQTAWVHQSDRLVLPDLFAANFGCQYFAFEMVTEMWNNMPTRKSPPWSLNMKRSMEREQKHFILSISVCYK